MIKGGQVITGIAGGEYGIRGYINSTNIETGKQNWRTYTIPAPGEPGSETWKQGPEDHSKNAWMHGGGSTWVTGTYDEDTNTISGAQETLVLIGIMNTDQVITYTVIVH